MKRIVTIIILASFVFSLVWWYINENKTLTLIVMFIGFVASMIQIYEFFNKKNIVRKRKEKLLIYVSHGGTCRDPMAVVITQMLMRKKGVNMSLNIKGRALYESNLEVSKGAQHAIKSIYNDDLFLNYSPERITKEICDEANLILVMSNRELEALIREYPNAKDKSHVFKEFFGLEGNIDDPIGSNDEIYLDCANEMKNILTEHFDFLIRELSKKKRNFCK